MLARDALDVLYRVNPTRSLYSLQVSRTVLHYAEHMLTAVMSDSSPTRRWTAGC